MKVLVSKLGALGDLIHSLPALTDAASTLGTVQFDWIVEEAFGEIPKWHSNVDNVFLWSSRRWRKGTHYYRNEITSTIKNIRTEDYDVIIDAQGILKATLPALFAKGPLWGYHESMIGDRFAAVMYRHKFRDNSNDVHASYLVRGLFAKALGYTAPSTPADPNIEGFFASVESPIKIAKQSLILMHGTTWENKHVPLSMWQEIIELFGSLGWRVYIPALGERERIRAEELAQSQYAEVLPALSLTELAALFAKAGAAIGPDTGLCHVAAAVGTPTLVLFGPSKEFFYRPLGRFAATYTVDIDCAPCMLKQCPLVSSDTTPPCWQTINAQEAVERLFSQIELKKAKV